MKSENSEKTLGLLDLFGLAIGTIIGAGVMTMTGIGIGITGRSVNIAYLIAAVLAIVSSIPNLLIAGTANFKGGQYSQIGVLSGKTLAGMYVYLQIAMCLATVLTCLSFAQYFESLFPGVNQRLVAFLVITIFIGINIVTVKGTSRVQNLMVFVLLFALGLYIIMGWSHVTPNYFEGPEFMTNGIFGVIRAGITMKMAISGATYVVGYSSKAKNPVRDFPIVIIGSTLAVAVLYTILATVAAGVLPVAEVARKPLSVSAATFMSGAPYTFFVVGGAMFALLTTVNGGLGSKVYPMMVGAQDGWFPAKLGEKNERFKTPHRIYLIVYLLVSIPILSGLDISVVANNTVIIITCMGILMAFSAMNLPKVMPELWNKSKFHVSDPALAGLCWLSVLANGISLVILIFTKSLPEILMNLAILGSVTFFALIRRNKATISPSYSEA